MSEGYQRLFAAGKLIRLIDKERKTAKIVGTKDAFCRRNFSSYRRNGEWSPELEDEWAERENEYLPHLRRLNAGARDEAARQALKPIAALHYVRSYAFEEIFGRIHEQIRTRRLSDFVENPQLASRFRSQMGREPEPGELEEMVETVFTEGKADRTFFVERMADGYNKTLDLLEPHHVQLIWPLKPKVDQFVFGDLPLVHWSKAGVSALGGVALGDAERVFLPIGPSLACLFTVNPVADGGISRNQVHYLNGQTWRAASRHVGAHPSCDVKRALNQWDLRLA